MAHWRQLATGDQLFTGIMRGKEFFLNVTQLFTYFTVQKFITSLGKRVAKNCSIHLELLCA